jgi:hypothetical protein
MDTEQARIVAKRLLEEAALARADGASERLEELCSAEYWRQLNPHLNIEGDLSPGEAEIRPLDEAEREEVAAHIADRGYFHTGEVLSPGLLAGMAQAVEATRRAEWPETTCFVYDEFWTVARTPSVRMLLRESLGEGYAQVPKIWCHYVHPSARAHGWTPHIDGKPEDPREHRLTVWVPLTEATLDNGCMYLIPRDQAPSIQQIVGGLERADFQRALIATRALPAHPGELLGWDHHTLHWGSSATGDAVTPRVSLSFEFLSADATAHAEEEPRLEVDVLPSFEQRLDLIARGMATYEKFEPVLALHGELFRQLRERLDA